MDEKTKKILEQDTVAESEVLLGKDSHEWNMSEGMFALYKAMIDGKRKNEYLEALGDTYFNMPWDEFKNLLKARGLVEALSYKFKKYEFEDEFILYYHPTNGWVVYAESYMTKDVNSGHLYLEIEYDSVENKNEIYNRLSSGGNSSYSKNVIENSYDVREGLFSKLDDLAQYGKFVNPWIGKDRFLWFEDYSETGDYKKISQSKIEKCPEEFRKIIGR